jgi:hypothetical protein
MLPLLEQSGVCQGHGSAGSGRQMPVLRQSARAAPVAAHAPLLSALRSRPLPVGGSGKRGGGGKRAGAAGSATAAAASPSLATPPGSLSGAAGCLSRQVVEFGYDRGIEDRYAWGRELGKGGNGVVRAAVDRASGAEFAVKVLPKALSGPDASEAKRRGHVESIRREVEVLRRLSGSLAVVRLVDVYEDDDSVYLVQELCRGGELHHRIGTRHYSERTVRRRAQLAGGGGSGAGRRAGPGGKAGGVQQLRLVAGADAVALPPPSCPLRSRPSCAPCCARWRSATPTTSCTATSRWGPGQGAAGAQQRRGARGRR